MKLLALALLLAPWGVAQKISSARAGVVYYAEGAFTVNGQNLRASSRDRRPQLNDGDIAASPRGHSEILMGPSAVLWTGAQTSLRFDDTSVENPAVTLLDGSIIVELGRSLGENSLSVRVGEETTLLARQGVYRFDTRAALNAGSLPRDEFHYFAAYRSLLLESESGAFRNWRQKGFSDREHRGFAVRFPEAAGAARAKYLAASEAGVLYYLEGGAVLGGEIRAAYPRLPARLGQGNYVRTEQGKAEIFLGVGIVARLGEHSQLRMIDTRATHPSIAVDNGVAMIEVASSAGGVHLRVRVDNSVTELLKPGVYRFDAQRGALQIYGGQATAIVADTPVRAHDSQSVNLRAVTPVEKFEPTSIDPLYKWSADRSFALYATAAFMTGWQEAFGRGRVRHKQYGERVYFTPRARRAPPRLL